MNEVEAARVVGEIVALLGGLFAAMRWAASRFLTLLHEVQQSRLEIADIRSDLNETNKQLRDMNGKINDTIERVARVEGPVNRG